MQTKCRVVQNLYRDSVTLMQISSAIGQHAGVAQAYLVMATPANLDLLQSAGLSCNQVEAAPNDLLIAVEAEDGEMLEQALDQAMDTLQGKQASVQHAEQSETAPRSTEMGLNEHPDANLVLISTPGEYAAAEARKALQLGLHTMIFSDNVTLEDEVALKQYAASHNLLTMGPDCGTAIIDGTPLGFANVVRRGNIGLVAASGTGLQQVSCLIDQMGAGISHAIGVGGRDLHGDVGGLAMQQGIALLAADESTDVIVLISKPPAETVAEAVLKAAVQTGKPVVVNFIGATAAMTHPLLYPAANLADAARVAVNLSDPKKTTTTPIEVVSSSTWVREAVMRLSPRQRYVRGLFSGGTFAYEALLILAAQLEPLYSNVAKEPLQRLTDVWQSQAHTLLDLGDDLFTRGRPHPMIDQSLRNARLLQEAADPETAVILLDVVLGYGAHPDPATEMAPTIEEARKLAAQAGGELLIISWVCGTLGDPQRLDEQKSHLADVGVHLVDSSTEAIQLAGDLYQYIDKSVGTSGEAQ